MNISRKLGSSGHQRLTKARALLIIDKGQYPINKIPNFQKESINDDQKQSVKDNKGK